MKERPNLKAQSDAALISLRDRVKESARKVEHALCTMEDTGAAALDVQTSVARAPHHDQIAHHTRNALLHAMSVAASLESAYELLQLYASQIEGELVARGDV